MPFPAMVVPVFIASPGDLPGDREIVREEINRWNRDHSIQEHVAFVPVAWEWAVATQGGGGQHQINEQQVRSADVVIAMFRSKLGAPTASHPSGTAEEISIGVEQGAHVAVLVSERPAPPGEYTGPEYQQLQDYIAEIRKTGLTQNYASDQELRDRVGQVLWSAARRFARPPGDAVKDPVEDATRTTNGAPDLELSHFRGDLYVVENVGSAPAHDVKLEGHETLIGPKIRDGGPDLGPGDQLSFSATVSGQTESRSITISWLDQPDAAESSRNRRTRLLPPRPDGVFLRAR